MPGPLETDIGATAPEGIKWAPITGGIPPWDRPASLPLFGISLICTLGCSALTWTREKEQRLGVRRGTLLQATGCCLSIFSCIFLFENREGNGAMTSLQRSKPLLLNLI